LDLLGCCLTSCWVSSSPAYRIFGLKIGQVQRCHACCGWGRGLWLKLDITLGIYSCMEISTYPWSDHNIVKYTWDRSFNRDSDHQTTTRHCQNWKHAFNARLSAVFIFIVDLDPFNWKKWAYENQDFFGGFTDSQHDDANNQQTHQKFKT